MHRGASCPSPNEHLKCLPRAPQRPSNGLHAIWNEGQHLHCREGDARDGNSAPHHGHAHRNVGAPHDKDPCEQADDGQNVRQAQALEEALDNRRREQGTVNHALDHLPYADAHGEHDARVDRGHVEQLVRSRAVLHHGCIEAHPCEKHEKTEPEECARVRLAREACGRKTRLACCLGDIRQEDSRGESHKHLWPVEQGAADVYLVEAVRLRGVHNVRGTHDRDDKLDGEHHVRQVQGAIAAVSTDEGGELRQRQLHVGQGCNTGHHLPRDPSRACIEVLKGAHVAPFDTQAQGLAGDERIHRCLELSVHDARREDFWKPPRVPKQPLVAVPARNLVDKSGVG
mmetsp:Transcript_26737/g.78777  ORF Transcript_26737/g.78777 Transcript_26737/m.78777 type:complete len:342 (+) Transcript_26737:1114-2139(+)